jgi:hypothetical protein
LSRPFVGHLPSRTRRRPGRRRGAAQRQTGRSAVCLAGTGSQRSRRAHRRSSNPNPRQGNPRGGTTERPGFAAHARGQIRERFGEDGHHNASPIIRGRE